MEPATAACIGVASVALGGWSAARIAALLRSLPDRLFPAAPSRIVAIATLAVVGFISAPKVPASADPVPPIVRLADGRVDSSADHGSPSPQPLAEPQPAVSAQLAPSTHVVVRGESLWRIARATLLERTGREPTSGDIARFWPHIYEANRAVIGDDPNLILPGQQFTIPAS
jgi:nucleoid-associated protein YgaU